MKEKHSKNLDDDRLKFAIDLIRSRWAERRKSDSPIPFISEVQTIFLFGNVSMQDVLDYIEATGEV